MWDTVATCVIIVLWFAISVCTYHIGKEIGRQEGMDECLHYVEESDMNFWKMEKLCHEAIMALNKADDEREKG